MKISDVRDDSLDRLRNIPQPLLFKAGSLASIWRYSPTPESSEGAGEAAAPLTGPGGVNGTSTGTGALEELGCEVFRWRLCGTGVRVFASQAGRVMVARA